MNYSPSRWYWIVGNRAAPDNIFSAPAGAYVAASDTGYAGFVAAGNVATRILTDGELADVLTQGGLPSALILAAAGATPDWGNVPAADIAAALLAAGCNITSTANPSTLNGVYSISDAMQGKVTAEAVYIQATGGPASGNFSNGTQSRAWPDAGGAPHTYNPTQFIALAEALAGAVDAIVAGATTPQSATIP